MSQSLKKTALQYITALTMGSAAVGVTSCSKSPDKHDVRIETLSDQDRVTVVNDAIELAIKTYQEQLEVLNSQLKKSSTLLGYSSEAKQNAQLIVTGLINNARTLENNKAAVVEGVNKTGISANELVPVIVAGLTKNIETAFGKDKPAQEFAIAAQKNGLSEEQQKEVSQSHSQGSNLLMTYLLLSHLNNSSSRYSNTSNHIYQSHNNQSGQSNSNSYKPSSQSSWAHKSGAKPSTYKPSVTPKPSTNTFKPSTSPKPSFGGGFRPSGRR